MRASLKDMSFFLQTVETSSEEAFGTELQGNLSFRLPFGGDPSLQGLFSWRESEELAYEFMIPHILDLAINWMTGEIYF